MGLDTVLLRMEINAKVGLKTPSFMDEVRYFIQTELFSVENLLTDDDKG